MSKARVRTARLWAGLAAGTCLMVAACTGSGSSGEQNRAGGISNLRPATTDGPAVGTATSTTSATPSATAVPRKRTKAPATTSPTRKPAGGASSSAPPAGSGRWTQVWADDFDGSTLSTGWGPYTGAIAAMPGGLWSADQVEVAGGMLSLHSSKSGGQWTSGGLMNYGPAQQTYGKYLVRFRMQKAPGVKYAIILWPASGTWPDDGEIDFAEDGGGTRSGSSATLHWGTASDHQQTLRQVKADFSRWHTVGVEWTPGKLVYTLDGKPYGTVYGSNVPSTPHNLVLQTEAGSCGEFMTCPDSTTPAVTTMDVDWVAAYRPATG